MPRTTTRVGCGTSKLDTLRRLHRDGVREAERELDVRALRGGTVADALDFEPLLVALRDALDHVRDERARQAVERAVVGAVGRPLTPARRRPRAIDMSARKSCASEPFGPWTVTGPARSRSRRPSGTGMGRRPIRTRDPASPHEGEHFAADAALAGARGGHTPFEVEMIAMPRPPSTRGRRSFDA